MGKFNDIIKKDIATQRIPGTEHAPVGSAFATVLKKEAPVNTIQPHLKPKA